MLFHERSVGLTTSLRRYAVTSPDAWGACLGLGARSGDRWRRAAGAAVVPSHGMRSRSRRTSCAKGDGPRALADRLLAALQVEVTTEQQFFVEWSVRAEPEVQGDRGGSQEFRRDRSDTLGSPGGHARREPAGRTP
jgi:hypothetical protein